MGKPKDADVRGQSLMFGNIPRVTQDNTQWLSHIIYDLLRWPAWHSWLSQADLGSESFQRIQRLRYNYPIDQVRPRAPLRSFTEYVMAG